MKKQLTLKDVKEKVDQLIQLYGKDDIPVDFCAWDKQEEDYYWCPVYDFQDNEAGTITFVGPDEEDDE